MPQKSQQSRLQRERMHTGVCFLGRRTRRTKEPCLEMTFREAVPAKWWGQQPGSEDSEEAAEEWRAAGAEPLLQSVTVREKSR